MKRALFVLLLSLLFCGLLYSLGGGGDLLSLSERVTVSLLEHEGVRAVFGIADGAEVFV